MIDFHSPEFRRNPYPVYDLLRSRSPLLHFPSANFWLLFDYENVRRALTDHAVFSSRAAPPGNEPLEWMIFTDPPRHTKLRALMSTAFTPRSISNLESRIREITDELLDAHMDRGEMDLASDLAVPLPMKVIAEMLGVPPADWQLFKQWSEAILGLIYTVFGGEQAAAAGRAYGEACAEMSRYLTDLLADRRAAPKDDLVTRMVSAEVDGERLTESEILRFIQLLLVAGSETTTNLINNAILCFLENPDVLAQLRANPALLPAAIEEVLRYRSPIQAMFRVTNTDVSMHGQTIAGRSLVLAMIGSANRDPRQFPDPDRFHITRDPNPHIAFGHGIHFCLGAPLARLESRVALSGLLSGMSSFERASSDPWEPRRAFHVHGPTSLPLRFEAADKARAHFIST